jgi:hypothetical protein
MPNLSNICGICKTDESPSWWKCCPKHTTEKGVDVVCEGCANRCMGKGEHERHVFPTVDEVNFVIDMTTRIAKNEILIKTTNGESKQAFAERMADYVETHKNYSELTKREAVVTAFRVLTEDIGAAQTFCDVIGLKIDLYDEDLYKE